MRKANKQAQGREWVQREGGDRVETRKPESKAGGWGASTRTDPRRRSNKKKMENKKEGEEVNVEGDVAGVGETMMC